MNKELISIIIPSYNAVNFIEETLQSLQKQTYPNWELIIVEDGPDDGTKLIVDKFDSQVEQNVVYHKNETNKGVSSTRNIAASLANGKWLAFLDSDDIWHQDHLLFLIRTAQVNQGYDLIYSSHLCFSDTINNIIPDNNLSKKEENIVISLFNGYIIQPSAIMVSSHMYALIEGFKDTYRHAEDVNFIFRLLKAGCKFIYSGNTTVYYRYNINGLSRDQVKMSYGVAKAYDELINFNEIPKKIRRKRISNKWIIAGRMMRKNNKKQAKEAVKKAIKYNLSLETLFYLILIYITPSN